MSYGYGYGAQERALVNGICNPCCVSIPNDTACLNRQSHCTFGHKYVVFTRRNRKKARKYQTATPAENIFLCKNGQYKEFTESLNVITWMAQYSACNCSPYSVCCGCGLESLIMTHGQCASLQSDNIFSPVNDIVLPLPEGTTQNEFKRNLARSAATITFNLNISNSFTIGVPQVWMYIASISGDDKGFRKIPGTKCDLEEFDFTMPSGRCYDGYCLNNYEDNLLLNDFGNYEYSSIFDRPVIAIRFSPNTSDDAQSVRVQCFIRYDWKHPKRLEDLKYGEIFCYDNNSINIIIDAFGVTLTSIVGAQAAQEQLRGTLASSTQIIVYESPKIQENFLWQWFYDMRYRARIYGTATIFLYTGDHTGRSFYPNCALVAAIANLSVQFYFPLLNDEALNPDVDLSRGVLS